MCDEHTVAWLRSLVHRYLSSSTLDAAKFYAERLFYENPSDDSLYLLALCYFRNGKWKQTYLILQRSTTSPLCKYLFALSCEKLDKLEEGERVLRPAEHRNFDKLSIEAVRSTPGGAEGVYLLGRFCRKQHRKDMAIMYYKLSLQLDPYLWSAITELSEMGVAVNVAELLNRANEHLEQGMSNSANVLRSADLQNPDRANGWLQEAREACAEQGYSAHNVFRDNQHLDRHRAAEHLGSSSSKSPRVSMALGLSSMSLHVPFASPGSIGMPSPLALLGHTSHSMMGADVSGFISTGLRSVPLGSAGSYAHRGGGGGGGDEGDGFSHLHGAKTALFGLDTPGLTPMSAHHHNNNDQPVSTGGMQGAMRGAGLMHTGGSDASSAIKGVHLFGDSAPSSSAAASAGAGAGAGGVPGASHGRRVSFGPTARLSFSGALDAGMHHVSTAAGGGMQSFDEDSNNSVLIDARMEDGERGEEYPFKHPRADPHATSPSAAARRSSEASSRALPHKLLMSPFPVESSPIPQHQHQQQQQQQLGFSDSAPGDSMGAGAGVSLIGEPFPSPTATTAGRKKYATRGAAAAAGTVPVVPATSADHANKENGLGAANLRRDGASAGIAGVDETFLGHLSSSGQQSSSSNSGGNDIGSSAQQQQANPRGVNHLVVTFARAHQMLSTYCCRACIHELQTQLPERHFRSGLVSQWIGKAFYEMNEYKSAMLAFREMLRVEPFRLCGLETLSTALWHLKRDKELCALAQQVVEVDKLSPEAWCVVGNCFSLQKEPDAAIKFFTRALQLDPAFPYAYTLCGHEQVNNEDLEKAVESFRLAVLHNDRHYNAWYGLGSIYFRQEKYELAEFHFRTALGINPASSVLHCYLGMALHAQRNAAKTAEALEVLTRAAQRDVDNPQLHFQRASILVASDRLPEALEALLLVEEHAPREPPVHALLGQVYHRLGELQLAIKHLNIAMDLDPKEASVLKGIVEQIDDPPPEQI